MKEILGETTMNLGCPFLSTSLHLLSTVMLNMLQNGLHIYSRQ